LQIEELQEIIKKQDAVMVYFSGKNCGVCKALQPKIEELFAQEFPKIKQVYISADEFAQTAAQFSVLTIPTVLVFFDAKEFIRESRHISIHELASSIQRPYGLFFN